MTNLARIYMEATDVESLNEAERLLLQAGNFADRRFN